MTHAARTLIDLAGTVDVLPLAMALESAWRAKRVGLDWIERRLRELGSQGRPGTSRLRRVLDDCRGRDRPLDSALEVQFWWLLKVHGFRLPEPGVEVRDTWGHPLRLDFAYVPERVAVETDGRQFHGDDVFERDRARLSRLAAQGWRVMHVTSSQLRDPQRLLGTLDEALRCRRP